MPPIAFTRHSHAFFLVFPPPAVSLFCAWDGFVCGREPGAFGLNDGIWAHTGWTPLVEV